MYNDYYLQQIDNKLSTTNNNLQTIIDNQETIIENQQLMYSGDLITRENQNIMYSAEITIIIVLIATLLYTFIGRCIKA